MGAPQFPMYGLSEVPRVNKCALFTLSNGRVCRLMVLRLIVWQTQEICTCSSASGARDFCNQESRYFPNCLAMSVMEPRLSSSRPFGLELRSYLLLCAIATFLNKEGRYECARFAWQVCAMYTDCILFKVAPQVRIQTSCNKECGLKESGLCEKSEIVQALQNLNAHGCD